MTDHRYPDPDFVCRTVPLVRAYTRYFSPVVTGLEHLPPAGPVLVVGNHSGLYWMPDVWVTALAMLERRGLREPSYALVHDLLLRAPGVGDGLRRLGALPAGMDSGLAGLKDGGAVLVYPGGDREACRPWRERGRVDLGGHSGFVRLALQAGVPVVPVVAHGGHDVVVILSRGEVTARLLGLGRLRLKVFPWTLGLPLGVAPVLPQVPLPAAVKVSFLPALDWSVRESYGDPEDPDVVAACFDATQRVMQSEMDRLRAACPRPVAEGLARLLPTWAHAARSGPTGPPARSGQPSA
ncbi:1-acyl-sn-glycerol-3-phosphate acyltransferase [Streptacidiphilus rugosus]|uniref:1-acyl-sn-glycerol-3-phosphate acyltransferase n=1 Tax=Streptacidiphilus rugosus TaxID=405783 RepID=UPI00068D208F|nr:1-acyl-sn-glycerol-3-phosphate acyltransferase [Streptacidiphilus rugosus]